MNNIKKYIGAEVSNRRKAYGFSQDDLAKNIGLTRTTIVNLECGRSGISIESFFRICCFLHCMPNDLLPNPDFVEWQYEDVEKIIYEKVPKKITVKRLKAAIK